MLEVTWLHFVWMARAHIARVHVQDIIMLSPSYVLNVSWTTPSVAQVHSVGWLVRNELDRNQRKIYSVNTTALANNLHVYNKSDSLVTYFGYKEKSSTGWPLLKWNKVCKWIYPMSIGLTLRSKTFCVYVTQVLSYSIIF